MRIDKDVIRGFDNNVDKWADVVSYLRWYPDAFWDMITPESGTIRLDLDQRVFLRSFARFFSTYAVFPRGYAKCVAPDTLIFTDNGIKEIGSFFDYDSSGNERYINSSINVANRYGKIEKTNAGVYSGFVPTKKIRTEEGFFLECTNTHPVLVMRNGKLDWVKSKDIVVGDFIPVSRGQNIWGNNTYLHTDVEGHFKSLNLSNQSYSGIMRAKCNTPNELTEEMALIIGYLIGDGTLTRDNMIGFTNKDDDIIKNYVSFMENVMGVNVKYHSDIQYDVFGMYIREYFNQIGLTISDALNKEVPKCIMSAPKNIVAAFIRGLFDTDGGISNTYIEYSTSSEKLSKQIQVILSNFGIISTRRDTKTKCNMSYKIRIYSKNMDIFLSEIGFSCKRKHNKLIELCNRKRNPNKDVIPNQKNLAYIFNNSYKEFESEPIYNNGKDRYLCDVLYHVLAGNNELTYEKLRLAISLPDADKCDGYRELIELNELNYFYSKVESIEDGENHVYDLSLPLTNSFVSNGLISHNTMLETMAMIHACIFYPGLKFTMTAQTKENASKIVKEKFDELLIFYPLLAKELSGPIKFGDDKFEANFVSGSKVDIMANAQSSKGSRRHRLNVEESALLNNALFEDVLEPIVNIPRPTVGPEGIPSPEELNGSINFLTTAGFRGSDEWKRSVDMVNDMANLKGKMVIGADWRLAESFGRGEPRSIILDKQSRLAPVFFAQNYNSEWVGAIDSALVNMGKLIEIRTLTTPELKGDGKSEYVIAMDVARSESTSNNQSSIVILKIKRSRSGKITRVQLVNLINLPNGLTFEAQTIALKKIASLFDPIGVCIDGNGLGQGIIDEVIKEHIDPDNGESLPAWGFVHSDRESPFGSEELVYELKAQGINHEIIVNFIDYIEAAKLQLLEANKENDYDIHDSDYYNNNILPYVQTDVLLEEISNLKTIINKNGKLSVERQTKKIDKDRWSALAYGLYYIKNFVEDDNGNNDDYDASKWLFIN